MARFQKEKGGKFERKVCTELSLWVTHGEKKDLFWRSAMSGGRATVALAGGDVLRVCGDICAVNPEGAALVERFYIECKHLKSIEFTAILKRRGKLLSVWQHTKTQASKYDRSPMLIIRQNLLPTLMCLQKPTRKALICDVPQYRLAIHDYKTMLQKVDFEWL